MKNKKTFFCAVTEIYENGEIKTAVIEKQADKMPRKQVAHKQGLSAYWTWFENRLLAEMSLARVRQKLIDAVAVEQAAA